MYKSVYKTLHTCIIHNFPNFTIYFTRNVTFYFQLLSSTTFWLCAMSTWVVRATSCQKFAGNRSSPGKYFFIYFLFWKKIHFWKKNQNKFSAVCMEPAVYLATLTTLDFCDSASKPHYSFVLSNRPCPLLLSSSNPMVTTRKANGMQTRYI